MDESRRLAMRRAHTKHKGFCTCGKVVAGNGRKNHLRMHHRRGETHTFLVEDAWNKRFRYVPGEGRGEPIT